MKADPFPHLYSFLSLLILSCAAWLHGLVNSSEITTTGYIQGNACWLHLEHTSAS